MHGDELHLMVIQGYDDHMTLRGQGHGFVRGRDYSFALPACLRNPRGLGRGLESTLKAWAFASCSRECVS